MVDEVNGLSSVIFSFQQTPNNVSVNGKRISSTSTSTPTLALQPRIETALANLNDAKDLTETIQSAATKIKSFLTEIKLQADTITSQSSSTDKETAIININLNAQRIDDLIDRTTFNNQPLLDGSITANNPITFQTGLTSSSLTRISNLKDFTTDSTSLNLGKTEDGVFSATLDGTALTNTTSEDDFDAFSEQVETAIDQVDDEVGRLSELIEGLDTKAKELLRIELEDNGGNPLTTVEKVILKLEDILKSLENNPSQALLTQRNIKVDDVLRILT